LTLPVGTTRKGLEKHLERLNGTPISLTPIRISTSTDEGGPARIYEHEFETTEFGRTEVIQYWVPFKDVERETEPTRARARLEPMTLEAVRKRFGG